jgi:hypothetical protein
VSTRGGTVFVDSNVLLDVLTEDPVWYAWSSATLAAAANQSSLAIRRARRSPYRWAASTPRCS